MYYPRMEDFIPDLNQPSFSCIAGCATRRVRDCLEEMPNGITQDLSIKIVDVVVIVVVDVHDHVNVYGSESEGFALFAGFYNG
jgi:hypothetical protein